MLPLSDTGIFVTGEDRGLQPSLHCGEDSPAQILSMWSRPHLANACEDLPGGSVTENLPGSSVEKCPKHVAMHSATVTGMLS